MIAIRRPDTAASLCLYLTKVDMRPLRREISSLIFDYFRAASVS